MFSKVSTNSIENINKRIQNEYCDDTWNKLTDEKLMDKLKECSSVKKRIDKLCQKLKKHNLDEDIQKEIKNDVLPYLIPAGTKGIIRGNEFNKIIKDKIKSLCLDKEKFDICFEKKCEKQSTDEIPDWYIYEKITNKTIIGMNQIDLWSGGAQSNRGSKYILNNQINSENCKLLCVVCNKIQFKSNRNKKFNLFKVGFDKNTLCYINNLQNIIYSYFNLK
jgi:hypothetical protein